MANNLKTSAPQNSQAESSYVIDVAEAGTDTEWNQFLESTPGGHHVQSTFWSQVKAQLGWDAIRIIARRNSEIVGGMQLLTKRARIVGKIGYVPKGPITRGSERSLVPPLVETMHRGAKELRVRYVMIQPPDARHDIADDLLALGFQTSPFEATPVGTTRVDLDLELTEIMAKMKSKTRYNIRLARKKGITVREGDASDLQTFFDLLTVTSERQGFTDYSFDYFKGMHGVLSRHGHLQLFIAEYEGEPVTAIMGIPFGDTMLFKKGGWSGKHGNLRPNEAAHAYAMEWAKSHGFRYYDLEGINRVAAESFLQNGKLPSSQIDSVTRFKIGFGGEVRLNPDLFGYVYMPGIRWAHSTIYPKLANWPPINRWLNGLKCNGDAT